MRVAVIVDNYPSPNNLYANGFIHERIKEYIKHFDCVVLAANVEIDYIYENVIIKSARNIGEITTVITTGDYDKIIVHFVKWWLIDYLININKLPVLVWVHGYETLSWVRYHFSFKPISFFRPSFYKDFVFANVKQRYYVRKLIKHSNRTSHISFVFVSKWMKRACECDTFIKVQKSHIIPNPINIEHFTPSEKCAKLASKILLVRSFNNRKYANDLAIRAILLLSKNDIFKKLEISIYGQGKDFNALTSKVKGFKNVKVYNFFLNHTELKEQHDRHGIFLCPTRMDAQGVSMCEAMASNLVIITSKNTAIPEFVDHNINGITTTSVSQIAEQIIKLNKNAKLFCSISRAASEKVKGFIDHETIIKRELFLINKSQF